MSYYRYHVFFCTNRREEGGCCQDFNAQAMRDYAKQRVKDLGLAGHGGVRINSAGCLDRCAQGPVIVVYPQETWYSYVDRDDIDDIIDSHLCRGQVVERLQL